MYNSCALSLISNSEESPISCFVWGNDRVEDNMIIDTKFSAPHPSAHEIVGDGGVPARVPAGDIL